jgi:cytochrome c peroxidase
MPLSGHNPGFRRKVLALLALLGGGTLAVAAGIPLLNQLPILDAAGFFATDNATGSIDPTGPFFQAFGTNGRACESCHSPAAGWTISAVYVKAVFDATLGRYPLFRTVDGSNCDHDVQTGTLAERRSAYSLLLNRGLIRVARPVPANAEFAVANVSNPYQCSESSSLSLYRRPLPATNLRFLTTVMWDGRESSSETNTTPITADGDPQALRNNLAHQALDAINDHAQPTSPLNAEQQRQIVNFEMGLTTSQAIDRFAGRLDADGASGGVATLASQSFTFGINDPMGPNFNSDVFNLFDAWGSPSSDAAKASILRGQALFNTKPISISGVAGVNDVAGIPVIAGTCATCHNAPNIGTQSLGAIMDIGTADSSSPLDLSYLPVITLRNTATGEIIQTTDPGRALVTGKWQDIGKVKVPGMRALSTHAPYFHNGSAKTLSDTVTFYDIRFNMGLTDQEKIDLVNFLNAL